MTTTPHPSLFGSALRGILAALGSDVAQKFFGVVATLIILAVLSPYDYGLWQLGLSVLIAFDVILFPSVASMLIADVSREIGSRAFGKAGSIVRAVVPLSIVLGALGALAMGVTAPFVSAYSGIDLTLFLQVMALALIAEGFSQGYQVVLQGTLSLVHAQILKVLKRASYVAGIIFFVFFAKFGLMGLAYAYVSSIFIPLIFYAPIVIPRYQRLIAQHEGSWLPFFEAGFERGRWLVGADLIGASVGALTPWIIGYYLSVAEIGYISLATMLLGQAASLAPVSFILRSILPRTLTAEGRTRAWLTRSMKYAVWSQLCSGILVVGAAALIIPFLYPQYSVVVPLTAAFILALPVRVVGTVAAEWFYAARRQRALFLVSNLPKIVLLSILPIFLWGFGLLGFVLHYLLSSDILTFLRLRLVGREEGGRILLREIVVPDKEDATIFWRILDAVRSIRYTRF